VDFSGLVKGVQDFWNFIWPPVICLSLLLGIPALLAPSVLTAGLQRIERHWPDSPHQVTLFKFFKRFGIDKLVPVITAFVLIFLLDVLRNAVLFAGTALPPNISYDTNRLLLYHARDGDIRSLWFKTGKPADFFRVQQQIEFVLGEAEAAHKDRELHDVHYWSERAGRDYSAFGASKFFVLWSAIFCIIGIRKRAPGRRPVLGGVLMTLFFMVAAGVFSIRFVYAIEQSFYAQTRLADTASIGSMPDCVGENNPCSAYQQMVEAMTNNPSYHAAHWWFISETDVISYLRWLREQARNQLG
jgi:hypothetical protein